MGESVGVDAGISALVTLSRPIDGLTDDDGKVANPRHERAERRRLAKAHRDFLHKLSTRLVHENQVIAVEDLTVRGMVQNRSPARAISDAAWRELRSMPAYKAKWYGRELVVVDRWFPSSKLCSVCGAIAESLPLDVRSRQCGCGAVHDRDVNAAKNILAAGLAER